ncbi:uncharacterized protein METZ01_LOCUS261730, partial [marine metagenome]
MNSAIMQTILLKPFFGYLFRHQTPP